MNTMPSLPPEVVEALLVDTLPWLSCEECFEQMDTYVETLLADPGHDDPAMRKHLQGCVACDEEALSLLELLSG